jgi:hypothetical protein
MLIALSSPDFWENSLRAAQRSQSRRGWREKF